MSSQHPAATAPSPTSPGHPLAAFWPIARGLLWAGAGFALGAGLLALLRLAGGLSAFDLEPSFAVGYTVALPAWILGVGGWERWGREWFGRPVDTRERLGLARYLTFTLDHKVIGIQYLITFLLLFLAAGLLAMLIRLQLVNPVQPLLGEGAYNNVMSLHGIIMIAVAVASVVGGFGNYLVPLLIGARDVAFPRLNALTFWLIPPVAVLLLAAQVVGGWDSGWTAYPPLSVRNAPGQLFFNLAIITFGLSSILGGLNFIVTIHRLRAPGMTWSRLPIFVWAMYATSWIALVFTQFFAAALLMVTLDRLVGTAFFDPARGGDALLYQHVFWFYSHPAVYIFVLPAFGIILEVLSTFARKPVFAYRWAVTGFLGILGLSGIVWAHHMFVSGMASEFLAPFLVTTELISIPTGLVFLSALGTIWGGRLWLRVPMLFALAMIVNFLVGGITGIFLADVPTDVLLHDTYFVVAHFHYTIVGGEIFALFAAIYYWFPKLTGKMYSERLGRLHFWGMFLGFNATFLPMFWAGLEGMNRRIAHYPVDLQPLNVGISLAAFVLGASFVPFVVNVLWSLLRRPAVAAGPNPWAARTLEWQTTSPPPIENFPVLPRVVGWPYGYGVPGAVHAVLGTEAYGAGHGEALAPGSTGGPGPVPPLAPEGAR
ncbi:MAG TPA: cbb3-type cytochrome c oxidase subunit I [Candidatus Binatia bacterium]|nr:cbb3-type cytochrome c oxidase subunit I [Candidatus Binatia bacterium]